MGCNCGKKSGTYSWQFTAPGGQTRIYSTEVEARAAQIRAGGGTIKTVNK